MTKLEPKGQFSLKQNDDFFLTKIRGFFWKKISSDKKIEIIFPQKTMIFMKKIKIH